MSVRDLQPSSDAPPDVVHNEVACRFEARVDGLMCVCVYQRSGNTLLLTHTEVPPPLAGRGIAAVLVQATLDWARSQGLRVRPLCSYVSVYMRRHPETRDLLA